jgi:deoxyribose-phosphate aldolase
MTDLITSILDRAYAYQQQLPEPPPAPQPPTGAQIAKWIDHTLLKAEATAEQVRDLCQEAHQYGFASVCVNPAYVPLATGLLHDSTVPVCAVVGFPLGAALPTYKTFETLANLAAGAAEIDMVINIGALKSRAYGLILNEVQAVAQVAHNQGAIVKVILEMAALSAQEKIIACLLCQATGVDFVKTSTGFGAGGATVEDVSLMFRLVGPQIQIKAAGGIRDYQTAQAMIAAGATRLGTSSGVEIVQVALGASEDFGAREAGYG